MLLVTKWSNLFISLRSEGFLISSHSPSLDREESESLLKISLIEDSYFSDALAQIFLIFLSSRCETEHLTILNSTVFCFFAPFSVSFQIFSTAWQQQSCDLGYPPVLPWNIPGQRFSKAIFWGMKMYTCTQSLQPSCTSRNNNGCLYAWGFSNPDACRPVVHQSLPSYYTAPLQMYCYHNFPELP